MDVDAARARWAALAGWQRWLAAYAVLALLAALVGLATPMHVGTAFFLTGAVVVLVSLSKIRLGGHRKTITQRDIQGRPIFKETTVVPERERDIREGIGVFLLGLALWAPLPLFTYFGSS